MLMPEPDWSHLHLVWICASGRSFHTGRVCCSIQRLNGEPTLELVVAEYNSLWRKLRETPVVLKNCVFNPHDFALTPNFFVFFQVH